MFAEEGDVGCWRCWMLWRKEQEEVSEKLRRGREIGASGEIPRAKS